MRSDRVPITVLSCNLTQHRPSLALNFKWPLTFVCTYHRHTSLLSFQLWALHLKWKHKRCPHFQTPEGHLTLDSFLWGINKTNPFQWPASLFKIILSSLWEKLSRALGLTRKFRVRPLWTHGIALVFHWLFIYNLLSLKCFFTLYHVNEILCGAVRYRLVCNPNPALLVLLLSLTRYIDINEQDEPFCVTKESNWVSESLGERITINLESSNLQEHSKLEIMSMIMKPALRLSFKLLVFQKFQ